MSLLKIFFSHCRSTPEHGASRQGLRPSSKSGSQGSRVVGGEPSCRPGCHRCRLWRGRRLAGSAAGRRRKVSGVENARGASPLSQPCRLLHLLQGAERRPLRARFLACKPRTPAGALGHGAQPTTHRFPPPRAVSSCGYISTNEAVVRLNKQRPNTAGHVSLRGRAAKILRDLYPPLPNPHLLSSSGAAATAMTVSPQSSRSHVSGTLEATSRRPSPASFRASSRAR